MWGTLGDNLLLAAVWTYELSCHLIAQVCWKGSEFSCAKKRKARNWPEKHGGEGGLWAACNCLELSVSFQVAEEMKKAWSCFLVIELVFNFWLLVGTKKAVRQYASPHRVLVCSNLGVAANFIHRLMCKVPAKVIHVAMQPSLQRTAKKWVTLTFKVLSYTKSAGSAMFTIGSMLVL